MPKIRLMKSSAGDEILAEFDIGLDFELDNARSVFDRERTGGRLMFAVAGAGQNRAISRFDELLTGEDCLIIPSIMGG
jgi:hypothetical protein